MTAIAAPTSGSFKTLEMELSQLREVLKNALRQTRRPIGIYALPMFWLLALGGTSMYDPSALANITMALLMLMGFVLSGIGVVYSLRHQVKELTGQLEKIQKELQHLGTVMITQGRHDERITFMHATQVAQGKRLDDLHRRFNTYMDLKLGDKVDIIEE